MKQEKVQVSNNKKSVSVHANKPDTPEHPSDKKQVASLLLTAFLTTQTGTSAARPVRLDRNPQGKGKAE